MPTAAPITLDFLTRRIIDAIAAVVDEDPVTDGEWHDTDPEAVEGRDALRNAIRDTLSAWLTHESTVDTVAQTLAVGENLDTITDLARETYRHGARTIANALTATLTQKQEPAA